MYSSLTNEASPSRFVTLTNFWTAAFLTAIAALTIPTMVMTAVVLQRLPVMVEDIEESIHYAHHFPPTDRVIYTDASGNQLVADEDEELGFKDTHSAAGRRLQTTTTNVTDINPCNFFPGLCDGGKYIVVHTTASSTDPAFFATCYPYTSANTTFNFVGMAFSHTFTTNKRSYQSKLTKEVANRYPMMGIHATTLDEPLNSKMHVSFANIRHGNSRIAQLWDDIADDSGWTTTQKVGSKKISIADVDMTFTNTTMTVKVPITPRVLSIPITPLKNDWTLAYTIKSTKPSVCW